MSLETLKQRKVIHRETSRVKVILKGALDKKLVWKDAAIVLSEGVKSLIETI